MTIRLERLFTLDDDLGLKDDAFDRTGPGYTCATCTTCTQGRISPELFHRSGEVFNDVGAVELFVEDKPLTAIAVELQVLGLAWRSPKLNDDPDGLGRTCR